ncbi:MAG: hypothetical protein JNL50_05185 [Phycisphaerae bacterium]|nr:hypothetical protein [Phycisphaerae bacterium]
MHTRPAFLIPLLALACSLGLGAPVSLAQPERQPEQPPESRPEPRRAQDRPPADAPPIDREKLKEELTRRLEETKRTQARLEQAIARLNEGGDPMEIRRDSLPERFRDRLRRGERDAGPKADRPGEPPLPGRDGSPGSPGSPGPRGDRKLSPEDHERMLRFLDEHMPRIAGRLRDALKENPTVAETLLARLGPKLRELEATQRSQPEMFELKLRDLRATLSLQEAFRSWKGTLRDKPDADRQKARESIAELVREQFEARLAIREQELAMLEKRIDSVRKELEDMRAKRDQRVNEEVDRWMNDFGPREPKPGDR